MKKIVLIIDDNAMVRQTLEDRIESMGFDFDSADCQTAAMDLMQKRSYDLILLDQELPVKKGKPTQKQVGRNLLVQIRQDANNEATPVIVVTAHDGDDSVAIADLFHNGANYFIHKPQIGMLEEKIRMVLDKHELKARKPKPADTSAVSKERPFSGGQLRIREEGIFLDDIRLASTGTTIGRILRELCKKTISGKRRAQSCKELAETLNLARGDKAVAEAVSPFRKSVIEKLREAGFAADEDAVIARGRGGYELAAMIEAESEVVISVTSSPSRDPSPEERQQWFITQAEEGKKPSKALYMKQFDQSESTWKRDLKGITLVLEIVGTGAGAYYRPKKKRLGGLSK
jgi:DNA-binding response OmpR family regulator